MLTLARQALGEKLYPVHRLDRATSGVLLFARDAETVRRVQAGFQEERVVKNYLALTRGIVKEAGLVDHAIAKAKGQEKRSAQTALRRLATFERYSLVELRPFTGRLHQIRRHLKHISHPIIGDTQFGKGEHNRRFRAEFDLHRLALHASKLRLVHPYSGERLDLRAPVPEDLVASLVPMGLAQRAEASVRAPVWEPDRASLPVLACDHGETTPFQS